MKLIEALKKTKDLHRKTDDLCVLVKDHCAISTFETQKYPNQTKQISEWMQAHRDILKEIMKLRLAIQKTNLLTDVVIEIDGRQITKSIAAWIHRRRDLAAKELLMWKQLTDRGINEGIAKGPTGDPVEIKINRFYDPSERDKMKDALTSEPSIIDARLEVVNAVTDLIED